MELFTAFFILVGTALSTVSGHVFPKNCITSYESALREALNTNEDCRDVLPDDCCQIMRLAKLGNTFVRIHPLETGINYIGLVCNSENGFETHSYSEVRTRCDMETDEGGWIVIQRRVSGGTENFARDWSDYKTGFGDLNGEFWYGLENIHCLTAREDVELRIDFKLDDGTIHFRSYQQFKVAGETDNYRLTIGQGGGSYSYDFMAYHNNRAFSTQNRDNDVWPNNCATRHVGGWWYAACYHLQPNYRSRARIWNGGDIYLDSVEMKVRPKTCI